MTGEDKTVEPKKGGVSGSLSGNKKVNSAQKKNELEAKAQAEEVLKVAKGRPPKIVSLLIERSKRLGQDYSTFRHRK